MSLTTTYINKCRAIADRVEQQQEKILQAATWFAASILAGRVVHVFGSGHSRIMVEEMWPRYGSFPGFNPIVELSLTYHNNVVGANGQRQAMYLENVPGLAERILRNFGLDAKDTALVISSSGCNIVPIEMAEVFQQRKIKVVSIVTTEHLENSVSKRKDGKKLSDFSDLLLDTGAPVGDSMIKVPGLDTPGFARINRWRRNARKQYKGGTCQIINRSRQAAQSAYRCRYCRCRESERIIRKRIRRTCPSCGRTIQVSR